MRSLKIYEGFHRPLNRNWLPQLVFGDVSFKASYIFKSDCVYDIGSDQSDINKLTGISFSLSPHKNSVRIGWRYSKAFNMIELLYYIYDNGVRKWEAIGAVPLNKTVYVSAEKRDDIIYFNVSCGDISHNQYYESTKPWKWLGYRLGLYFGGNRTAPHKITVVKKDKPYL